MTKPASTKQREEAAQLLAADKLSDEQIAATVGVTRQGLAKWKKDAGFMARVEAILAEYREKLTAEGIAIRENRLAELQADYDRTTVIVTERAADLTMVGIPGASSGFLVRTYKQIGSGDSAERVEEYAFDAALYRERRATLKQAAQEKGEWSEKTELSGPGGGPLKHEHDYPNLSDEELIAIIVREGSARTPEAEGGTA